VFTCQNPLNLKTLEVGKQPQMIIPDLLLPVRGRPTNTKVTGNIKTRNKRERKRSSNLSTRR
jgi:hypothetical protein